MIEKEIDGRKYYCFEPSETEARLNFEKSMVAEETIDKLFSALMSAISECERNKRNAWSSVQETIQLEFGLKIHERVCTYNWIVKGFEVQQDNPSANTPQQSV